MSTHYEVLGVGHKASARELRKAYERKMKAFAKNPDALQERIVKDAFAVLSNPLKRADYDSKIGESEALAASSPPGTPLLIGLVVVALTAAGIGFFLWERTKERAQMRMEERRAAEREKAKAAPAAPAPQQPVKRKDQ